MLLPLGARPHWGKIMHARAAELAPLYPKLPAFRDLSRPAAFIVRARSTSSVGWLRDRPAFARSGRAIRSTALPTRPAISPTYAASIQTF
jgi:hypothetical protein